MPLLNLFVLEYLMVFLLRGNVQQQCFYSSFTHLTLSPQY